MKILPLLSLTVLPLLFAACGGGGEEAPEAGGASEGAVPSGWNALEIDVPQAVDIGTPEEVELPNLDKSSHGKPADVYVPDGVKNVALGKTVTSSDEFDPIMGSWDQLVDGEKQTSDGYFIELSSLGLQWVQIDLGEPMDLYAIAVWHYFQQPRAYKDVVIILSNDPGFSSGDEVIVFNNDHDDSAGFGEGSDMTYFETNWGKRISTSPNGEAINAQYVRLYSNGSTSDDLNHYVEVEVYGK
ncbi:MAG: hypothetical protein AAF555_09485 [Verrucomicrobiota bacterium]